MKKISFLFILCLASLIVGLVNSCRKDPSISTPTDIGTKTSFTEEFEDINNLATKGWVMKDNSGISSVWSQGLTGYVDKAGIPHGFPAYSYTTSPDEFAYSPVAYSTTNHSISSWLISPVLSVKNGDKISFYSRADSVGGPFTERMQVLMNNSASADVGSTYNSTGRFTTVLFDINPGQVLNGYPLTWTKYEYTFSGITDKTDTRIGFRHYVINTLYPRGVGIDLFKFQVN